LVQQRCQTLSSKDELHGTHDHSSDP
jgi:hypothetical protein